jgi:two-component system chemotaxis response regulator CheY
MGGTKVTFRGLRVLVVDDDQAVCHLLGDLLRFWGCAEVNVALNGKEGVQKYQQVRPDLVLMDMDMPLMSGFDASRAITELDPQATIVLVTGLPDSRLAQKALEKGVVRVAVPKPFSLDQLAMAIQEALKKPLPQAPARKEAIA